MARSAATVADAESATAAVAVAVATAYESDWGRIIATLIRITGDWSIAEDSAQDAFELALQRWARDGVPRNPGAWLTTAAKNRAVDRLRRAASEASKLREIGIMNELESWAAEYDRDDEIVDDRLRLIFTCCHPALTPEARVALTLRTVAGLSTAQIARGFLLPEQAMSQRLVRAKRKIKNAGIPYRVPPAHLLGERLGGVLAVLYLLFNEGYSASSRPLASEAIRVTRALVQLMPDEPEAAGLLALMLLQDSRRDARMGADGVPLTLEEQDRGLWDLGAIDEGLSILVSALRRRRPGSYQVQAAIAACHAEAATADETDWAQIVGLYDQLRVIHPSPVIDLSRAIAVAMLDGPEVGLVLVSGLEPVLADYYLLAAARGDLLRRLGKADDAILCYRDAITLAPSEPERRFFARRIAELG